MDAVEYVAGLRAFADWVEEHHEMFEYEIEAAEGSPMFFNVYALTAEQFRTYVRALGRGDKKVDETYFRVERRFGPITAYIYTNREKVCERRVVGTREEKRIVRDPQLLERVPMVEVTETIEDVEWVCEPSILAGDDSYSIRVPA